MKNDNNYTGIRVGLPLSTPTNVSLYINGKIIKSVDLWEGNETGKKVRKAYEKEKTKIEHFFDNLKNEITKELEKTGRKVFFDDDFVFTGYTSSQWGGVSEYKGIKFYYSMPSPRNEGDPLLLNWTFRTKDGKEFQF
ncbi:hypothetical protein [Flavobacterium mekongense]|uniref:hypothetical protein n=1 Tax=Flavobacterium mekongense TaxID=3379707 RepID=UPI00399C00D5